MKSAESKSKAKENDHKDHRKRMRNRFASTGFDGWAKHEVIEFLLFNVFAQQDTNELAHKMLNQSNKSISRLFENAQTDCLKDIKGVGDSTLVFLRTIKAFMGYYHSEVMKEEAVQLTSKNFADILSTIDFPKDTEDILMICMDNFLRIKFITRITDYADEGSATTTPERIIRAATSSGAKKVILVHNHPSGNPRPSYSDMLMTEQVERLLRTIGSDLVDHYIISGDRMVGIKVIMREAARREADLEDNII